MDHALEDARALLEVSESADEATIGQACRRLSRSTHPDKGGSTEMQQRINAARDLLLAALRPPPSSDCSPAGGAAGRGGGGTTRARVTGGRADDEDEDDAYAEAGGRFEAEADDRLPEERGGPKPKPKRKKQSGGARQAAAKKKKEGGYVDRGRRVFKDHGGALATGTKRTCVADALWVLLNDHEYTGDLEDVRTSIMPSDPDENTLFDTAGDYAAKHGFKLSCVSKEFQQTKGGYAYNLFARDHGYFLVQLRVTSGPSDLEPPDLHVVAYDGKTIRDNNKYTKVKILEPSDRTKEGARLVFDSLFNGLEVRISNIFELCKN